MNSLATELSQNVSPCQKIPFFPFFESENPSCTKIGRQLETSGRGTGLRGMNSSASEFALLSSFSTTPTW